MLALEEVAMARDVWVEGEEEEEGVAMCLGATISSHHQCRARRCELLLFSI